MRGNPVQHSMMFANDHRV